MHYDVNTLATEETYNDYYRNAIWRSKSQMVILPQRLNNREFKIYDFGVSMAS